MSRTSNTMLAILICTATAVITTPIVKVQAKETSIGTPVGNVLFTDIQTFVNGTAIRSMNIDGNTAIYVEDLRGHGFDVAWEPNKRQVSIFPDNTNLKPSTELPDFGFSREGIGNKIADVLATDIQTFALNKEIQSYNVGGKTAIFLKDLSPFLGSIEWNEKSHLASFHLDTSILPDQLASQSNTYPLQVEQTSSTRFTLQFADEGIFFRDDQIGIAQDGIAMLSIVKMAQFLNYQTEIRENSIYTHTNTYGFQISPNLDTASLYWFNGQISEEKLAYPTIEQDGEIYVSEFDLKQLFGYIGNWDSDNRTLDIYYPNYSIKDFGVAEHTDNYWYALNGLLFTPSTNDLPQLTMSVSRNDTQFGGSSSTSVMEQETTKDSRKYQFSSAVQLEEGDNEINITYRLGKRILYSKTIANSLTATRLKPVINYNDLSNGLGEFSSISLEAPLTGLTLTEDGKVDVKGSVNKAVGKGLTAVVEKVDKGSWSSPETISVPFNNNRFETSIKLAHGTGRYQITLRSDLSTPGPRRVNSYIDVARFYVKYSDPLPRILGMQGSDGFSWRDGKLLQTKNTGFTWDIVTPDGISEKDRLVAADFKDIYWGYAFYHTNEEHPKLVASHVLYDEGWETTILPTVEAWETSSDVKVHIANLYLNPAYVMLTSVSETGQLLKSLYRTNDNGKSWIRIGDLNVNFGNQPTGISFRKEKMGWITSMNNDNNYIPLYQTQDGGLTWSLQKVALPADIKAGYANAYPPTFDQENDYHAIFIAEFIQDGKKTYIPYETRDAGETWKPLPYRLNNIQDIPVLHFEDLLMGRAISIDGKTIYTMDTYLREDWNAIHSNISLQNAKQFYLRTDGFGWVLLNGSVLVTTDGGRTWEEPTHK